MARRRPRRTWRNTTSRAVAVPGLGLVRPGETIAGDPSPHIDALVAAGALTPGPDPVEPTPVPVADTVDHADPEEAA